jgi:hypothetical protein
MAMATTGAAAIVAASMLRRVALQASRCAPAFASAKSGSF